MSWDENVFFAVHRFWISGRFWLRRFFHSIIPKDKLK
jgi:hypothetical protein